MGADNKETVAAFVVLTATFAVYLKCLHPSLPGGDSGELIVAAYEVGVAHPPGYPLFTLLSQLFICCIPVGSVAWKVNLLSACCGALCAFVVYLLIYRLTVSHSSSLLGACLFSFSRLTWTWSVSAEVFSLNNLLVACLMLVAVKFDGAEQESLVQWALMGSFVCGLCLSNQHTSVVYVAVMVPWALYRLWKNQHLTPAVIVKLTVALMCGLLPYIYLPVAAHMHIARWTWGDQRTLMGFLTHLLRMEYGTWDLLKNHTGQGLFPGLFSVTYASHCATHLTCFPTVADTRQTWLLLCFTSRWLKKLFSHCCRYKTNMVVVMFYIMLFLYLVFFCWRANLDIKDPLLFRVVERFWMQADLVVIVLASVTFSDICRIIGNSWNIDRLPLDMILVLAVIGSHLSNKQLWNTCDHSSNFVVHDFAVQTLQTFPSQAIVLTKGDLPSNSFRYFHLCENIRPDLTVFDQEMLTYEWSLPMTGSFYPGIMFPGDLLQIYSGLRPDNRVAFRFKDLIDANYESHPIFACIGIQDHEPSWKESYILWPFGSCWQIIRKGTVLDISTWTSITSHLADQWKYPWTSANDGTWEDIANSEMWNAKISTAYFYLELASSMPDGHKEVTLLLLESYKLFTRAIEKERSFPALWHRNYAILCERLQRVDTTLDRVMLLKKAIFHFKKYVHQAPDDTDSQNIRHAVATLEDYMNSLTRV
ncbi:unnamed protein product [Candidula unifasciata]|uniref:Transmembrane protein 260 n=1 Tax=Candidula unifasciata TaxID=100452 RepID=A0A8S3YHV8_9EUPU|nr:unnamed protein product [Candidula unifasciata]